MQRTAYYPQHFAQTRPYLRPFITAVDERMRRGNYTHRDMFNIAAKQVSSAVFSGHGVTDLSTIDPQAFALECRAAMLYNAWRLEGGIIYEFDAHLTEALKHSSLSEVCINDLSYPFETIYFHFGKAAGFRLTSGEEVTGAYVYYAPGVALRITLTSPKDVNTFRIERGYEIYDLGIKAEHFSENLEVAVVRALEDDLRDIESALTKVRSGKSTATLTVPSSTLEKLPEMQKAQFEVFRQVTLLVANGLCYATAYKDDIKEIWPPSTPEKLKTKASGEDKEAQRAASKLNAMGYQKVRYMGQAFAQASEETGAVSPHMRRGHWRNQAHGPSMKLRKLVWIRQTRVLGASASDEPRVYEVRGPSSS